MLIQAEFMTGKNYTKTYKGIFLYLADFTELNLINSRGTENIYSRRN